MVIVCASKAVVMSVAHVAVRGQVEVCGPAMVRGHVDAHGQCCHVRPDVWSWSVFLPRAMMVSMVHAATGVHVNVHTLCSNRGPWS